MKVSSAIVYAYPRWTRITDRRLSHPMFEATDTNARRETRALELHRAPAGAHPCKKVLEEKIKLPKRSVNTAYDDQGNDQSVAIHLLTRLRACAHNRFP